MPQVCVKDFKLKDKGGLDDGDGAWPQVPVPGSLELQLPFGAWATEMIS